jgi:hypothetical protein
MHRLEKNNKAHTTKNQDLGSSSEILNKLTSIKAPLSFSVEDKLIGAEIPPSPSAPKNSGRTREDKLTSLLAWIKSNNSLERKKNEIAQKGGDEWYNFPEYKNKVAHFNKKKNKLNKGRMLEDEDMRMIIEVEKAQRKGVDIRVFGDMDRPEFKRFLEELITLPSTEKAFQIIIGDSEEGMHWSAADILVHDDEIKILHVDSKVYKNRPKSTLKLGANGEKLQRMLLSVQSEKKIKMTECYTGRSGLSLQKDEVSCGTFALDAALTMSKTYKLHGLVDKKAVKNKYYRTYCNPYIYSMAVMDLPAGFLKNAQTFTLINNYKKRHKNDDLNKIWEGGRYVTLQEYTAPYRYETAEKLDQPGVVAPQNIAVYFALETFRDTINNQKKNSAVTGILPGVKKQNALSTKSAQGNKNKFFSREKAAPCNALLRQADLR